MCWAILSVYMLHQTQIGTTYVIFLHAFFAVFAQTVRFAAVFNSKLSKVHPILFCSEVTEASLFFAYKTVWDIQLSFILNCAKYTLPSVALRYMSVSLLLISLCERHSFPCFRPVHSAVVFSLWCGMKNTCHAKP